MNSLEEEIELSKALAAHASGATPTSTSTPATTTMATPDRTLASPDWDGETIQNAKKNFSLAGISVSDFDASHTPLGLITTKVTTIDVSCGLLSCHRTNTMARSWVLLQR